MELEGIELCCEVSGQGKPLVLVHGFGSKKEVFIGQFKVFSEKYKVIRFDNRGSGKSTRPDYNYSMDMYVEDLKQLLDRLEIKKAHILGYSLGGMIVQNFAIKYPERLDKLILINTVPKVEFPEEQLQDYIKGKIANYELKSKDPVSAFYEGAEGGYTPEFINYMKQNPKTLIHDLFTAEDLIRDATELPTRPQDYYNQAPTLLQHDVLDNLAQIQNETLIICASKDPITPKEQCKIIHEKINKSKFVEIDGMHSTPKEKAPEINKIVLEFLEKN
ncbi:MAG: alpha/beta hydrolase [Candidatus Lokiarchaeota archaeon]|nr:alpha/beta hydrolase [Candidatus Lokiarchaeota archaeon]